jgi:DNA-binding NarL/FixJ family response regulator
MMLIHNPLISKMMSTKSNTIQFYLVDQQEIYRKGIRTALSMFKEMIECYELDTLDVFMQEKDHVPDIILLGNDLDAKYQRIILKHILQKVPDMRVILSVDRIDERMVLLLQEFAVHGCILRSSTELEVMNVVLAVISHKQCYTPTVTAAIRNIRIKADSIFHQTQMTVQEYTIVKLLCKGLNMEEIAAYMGLHPRAVTGLLSRVKQLTGERTAQGLIGYMLKNKIISLKALLTEEYDGENFTFDSLNRSSYK